MASKNNITLLAHTFCYVTFSFNYFYSAHYVELRGRGELDSCPWLPASGLPQWGVGICVQLEIQSSCRWRSCPSTTPVQYRRYKLYYNYCVWVPNSHTVEECMLGLTLLGFNRNQQCQSPKYLWIFTRLVFLHWSREDIERVPSLQILGNEQVQEWPQSCSELQQ